MGRHTSECLSPHGPRVEPQGLAIYLHLCKNQGAQLEGWHRCIQMNVGDHLTPKNIQEYEIVVGGIPQTIPPFSAEVFIYRVHVLYSCAWLVQMVYIGVFKSKFVMLK